MALKDTTGHHADVSMHLTVCTGTMPQGNEAGKVLVSDLFPYAIGKSIQQGEVQTTSQSCARTVHLCDMNLLIAVQTQCGGANSKRG
jgi:hypothetical protein